MRDKYLYQRRKGLETQKGYTKGYNYKGYTKDGFYFKTTTAMWCWKQKQDSKEIIHERRTIEELKKLKNEEFIGKGNYNHQDTHGWVNEEYIRTEEFAKICGMKNREGKTVTKNYISMLLKRGTTPLKNYENNSGGAGIHKPETRQKNGLRFINCLKKSGIEYFYKFPYEIYNKKLKDSNNFYMNQKIWVFKKVDKNKIKIFKDLWQKK